jgi:lipopolysaccharide transport protein LptA
MFMRTWISLLFSIVLLTPALLFAEKEEKKAPDLDGPLAISSEKMTVKGLEDKVFFEGSVAILKGDVEITAGRATVLLADKDQNAGNKKSPLPSAFSTLSHGAGKEIVQIQLSEKVEVRQGSRRVLAQKGIYDARESEIILTGRAEMWEDGYHVKGRSIRLSLATKRSFVEGSQLTIY